YTTLFRSRRIAVQGANVAQSRDRLLEAGRIDETQALAAGHDQRQALAAGGLARLRADADDAVVILLQQCGQHRRLAGVDLADHGVALHFAGHGDLSLNRHRPPPPWLDHAGCRAGASSAAGGRLRARPAHRRQARTPARSAAHWRPAWRADARAASRPAAAARPNRPPPGTTR